VVKAQFTKQDIVPFKPELLMLNGVKSVEIGRCSSRNVYSAEELISCAKVAYPESLADYYPLSVSYPWGSIFFRTDLKWNIVPSFYEAKTGFKLTEEFNLKSLLRERVVYKPAE